MTHPMLESFSWLAPEFKTQNVGPNKIRIKGIALRSDIVSKNNRKYVADEVNKSGRTLCGKPITINHDNSKIVGNIEWAEPEDGLLEYVGIVNKQPYVDMIRNNDERIKGVSVDADYLHAKCTVCGKQFHDMELFIKHMTEDEHIRNFQVEPHQILMKALSLVVDPEVPGVPNTTVQLMESFKTFSQLCECITQDAKEREQNMQKANVSVQPEKHVAPIAAKEAGTSTTPEATVSPLPTDQTPISTPASTPPKEPEPIKELKLTEPCSPELKRCVDALIADGKPEDSAWAICKSKLGETILLKIKESANIEKLKLEEPYDWTKIHETKRSNEIAEVVNKLIEDVNKPLEIHVPVDDRSWEKAIASIPKDDLTWKPEIATLKETLATETKKITESITSLPKDDLTWKEHIEKHPADDISWKEQLATFATKEALTQAIAAIDAKLKEYDSIKQAVDKADKTVTETANRDAELRRELEETKKLLADTRKQLEETAKVAEDAKTLSENTSDKLKGKFKGKATEITQQIDSGVNPLTGK